MSDRPETDVLLVRHTGAVTWLTLNRPAKCNALSTELSIALARACRSIPAETAIVVLEGAGKHFCAGSDLKDLYQVDRKEAERVLRLEMDACHALAALPQLTVAILHGKCYGGGAFLPLYCDFRLGRAGFELALPEVPLGWVPPYGLERLRATVSPIFALEMLVSGRVCRDHEALERGWIHRLLEPDESETSYVEHLGRIPRRTLLDTLALAVPPKPGEMQMADEEALAAFLDHFDTDYARNKIASFMERKRS